MSPNNMNLFFIGLIEFVISQICFDDVPTYVMCSMMVRLSHQISRSWPIVLMNYGELNFKK